MFPKIVGFPPKSSSLIGFSMIFTIHFGGNTLFLETLISRLQVVILAANKKTFFASEATLRAGAVAFQILAVFSEGFVWDDQPKKWLTPPKLNMEPENDGFQREFPFLGTSFQIPC